MANFLEKTIDASAHTLCDFVAAYNEVLLLLDDVAETVVMTNVGDMEGDILLPSPLPRNLIVPIEHVFGSYSIVLPNSLTLVGTHILICIKQSFSHTLTLRVLNNASEFYVGENFGLPITQVGVREFTVQLPNNNTDRVVIAMVFNYGAWCINASVYKTPTVTP